MTQEFLAFSEFSISFTRHKKITGSKSPHFPQTHPAPTRSGQKAMMTILWLLFKNKTKEDISTTSLELDSVPFGGILPMLVI